MLCSSVCALWQRLKVHYGPHLSWATAARVAPRPFYSGPWLDKGLPPSWFAAVLSRPDFTRCSKRASGGTRHLLPHLPHLHFSALTHTHAVLFTAFPDLAITIYNWGERKKRQLGRGTEREQQRDMFNRVWGTLYIKVSAVGLELCLDISPPLSLSIHLLISGSQKGDGGLKAQERYLSPLLTLFTCTPACEFHPLF